MLTQRTADRDCYCCSHLSRKTQDEKLAKLVLPLAPKDEWNLFWNPEELPPTTGSKQLDNFIVLRLIFVYLPLDLETLLSVASTCRAWRLVSDRLPHWRYLLPLRTEVLQIMSENHWFDRDYSRGTYPKFEKDFSPFDDEYVAPGEQPHYNLKVSSRMLAYIKSGATPGAAATCFGNSKKNKNNNNNKRKTIKKIANNRRRARRNNDGDNDDDETTSDDEDYQCDSGELEENNNNNNKNKNEKTKSERPTKIPGCRICPKCCCDSSDDVFGDGCGACSSCECSSHDDVKEEFNIISDKERIFIATKGDTHVMLQMIGNEEREFAQQCFFNHRENLDWGQLLEENEKQKENEREKRRKLIADHRAKKDAQRKLEQQQNHDKERKGSPQATAVQSVQIAGPNRNEQPSDNDHHPEQEMLRRYPDGQENIGTKKPATKYPNGIDNNNNRNDDSSDVDSIELNNIPTNNNNNPNAAVALRTRYPQANDYGNASSADDEKENNVPNATARRRVGIASDSDSSDVSVIGAPAAAGGGNDRDGQPPNPDEIAVLREQALPSSDPLSNIVYSLKLDQFEKYITNHGALDEAKQAKQHHSHPSSRVYGYSGPTFAVRAQHSTLLTNSGKIMISKESAGFRRNFMFPTLSSYLSYVRKLLKASKKEMKVSFLEMYGDLIHFLFWCFLVFAIAYASSALLGFYVDQTSIFRATDQIVAREVSATIVIPVIFAFGLLISSFAESIFDREFDRPAMASKAWGLLLLMYGLSLMSVPVSLLFARVNVADRLLAGGEISVCDAWSSLPPSSTVQSSIFKSGTLLKVNSTNSQCKLPGNLLPESFAKTTFLEFPPGTKILYHPPDFLRTKIVPYSASYVNSTHCQVDSNTVIDFLTQDRGYNQTKSDVGRGNIGYYTIILPPSCSSPSNGIKNATVVILGDFGTCPFWSTNEKRTSLSASTQFLHPRFTGILSPATSASDTESTARSISNEFGDAILNVTSSTSSIASQTCATRPENLLVTVSSSSANSHKFYLRVSQGFIEHWSASYYIPRLPYSPADGGPYASRPFWRDTLDYQLNGVVALMADWKIFINHKNAAAPTTPHNYGDTENSNAFQDSDETGGKWNDDGMSPFWTAAHPAGIRRFRYDFFWGAIGYIIFAFCLFCTIGIWLVFSRGKKRVRLLIGAFLILICVGTQIPLLIQASICYALVAPDDSLELTNPVGCLQASEVDSQGVLIFASVFGGIYLIALMIAGCFACCEDSMDNCCDSCGECCDDCCEKMCDPICDCCKPICDCCEKCCKPCCDCLNDCCDCCCGKVCNVICCDSDTC